MLCEMMCFWGSVRVLNFGLLGLRYLFLLGVCGFLVGCVVIFRWERGDVQIGVCGFLVGCVAIFRWQCDWGFLNGYVRIFSCVCGDVEMRTCGCSDGYVRMFR